MKRNLKSIILLGGLLALLATLAVLQYRWLGEISDGERDRMQKRLQSDSQNFTEDFNRELRNIYFQFQIDANVWTEKDWAQFNKNYEVWRSQTDYDDLIEGFYFLEKDNKPLGYDFNNRQFAEIETSAEIEEIQTKFQETEKFVIEPDLRKKYSIIIPNFNEAKINRLSPEGIPNLRPEIFGFLVVKLNEKAVKNLLASLAARYFSPDNSADYFLSVTDQKDSEVIYQNTENAAANMQMTDISKPLFDLSINNFNMIVNNGTFSGKNVKTRIFTRQTDTPPALDPEKVDKKDELRIHVSDNQVRVKIPETKGIWTLNIRHSAGSLDKFIESARRKNLSLSFGILGLLALSIGLIFFSAQRAKIFAQRQIDFVSSVSHEFRTPLAVIYSAGENLADGVANEEKQVSLYGNLIKGEGKKLSAMVEQILDFAGARSGRKKYDLREQNVSEIIENALAECQPLIDEKGFTIEKQFAENLPKVKADANALSQAIQNLIFNSLKYSKPSARWLKISANNGGGKVKISVEDKGIGIAPRDLKHIFEPFYRAKSVVDEQIHGNGLGLSLVKETIEAHGGKISAESEIDKGSRFIVHLPGII